MQPKFLITAILSLAFLLSGCGKEGPFGNTPGPKKPVWNYDLGPVQEY
jgi:predicted small lipoprotein YifL